MKKLLLSVAVIMLIGIPLFSTATTGKVKPENPKAAEMFLPIGSTGNKISLLDLSQIARKDFEQLSGHKMNSAQKVAFRLTQKKLRTMIDDDGRVHSKMLQKATAAGEGFHIGGFALGFFLGLIGVLIAYLIGDDKKSKRVKWAWIGAAIGLALMLLIIIV